jgi:3-hydroxyisobutyrate dehydrogenase-like beta-hydroxyacid dehydrogenase
LLQRPPTRPALALPAANNAKEIFTLAMRAGLGGQDFSAVYKVLNEKK